MAGVKAQALVEAECFSICFRDGEGDGAHPSACELGGGVTQKHAAKTAGSATGTDAELRDVCGLRLDEGGEDHAFEFAGTLVEQNEGVLGREGSTAGEPDNVVEKAKAAADSAVLVVDLGVTVVNVGAIDEIRGRLVHGCGPAAKLEVGGQLQRRLVGAAHEGVWGGKFAHVGQGGLHKETRVGAKAALFEDGLQGGLREQELRFDAINAGGVLQHREKVVQQRLLEEESVLLANSGRTEKVSDDGLLRFVNGKAVAADAAGGSVYGHETGENAAVEIPEEELDGFGVFPKKTGAPKGGLFTEEGSQVSAGVEAQIANVVDGGRCRHCW